MHLTKQLGAEYGSRRPGELHHAGLIKTDFARILWEGDRGAKVASGLPLQRLGGSDIGDAAVWLSATPRG